MGERKSLKDPTGLKNLSAAVAAALAVGAAGAVGAAADIPAGPPAAWGVAGAVDPPCAQVWRPEVPDKVTGGQMMHPCRPV